MEEPSGREAVVTGSAGAGRAGQAAGGATGKVAIVTGAASGNGRGIALSLARAGAAVVVADVRKSPRPGGFDAEPGTDTDDLIRAGGGRSVYVRADVAEAAEVRKLVASAVDAFGRIDVLVNNAGIMPAEPVSFTDDSEDSYDEVMRVNARGAWLCCREAIRQMLRQQDGGRVRGKIVNVVSISGVLVGFGGFTQYAMSKGALHALTRTLAAEYAARKITVNAVAPGFFRTAMTASVYQDPQAARGFTETVPMGETGRPEDLGGVVSFLVSPAADYLTGTLIPVDGGYTNIAPMPRQ
jgi:NAD(P)-dependent dehydrogenase (short-subunit alcohol dehydrogenase family)